jgi:hypothetical protein
MRRRLFRRSLPVGLIASMATLGAAVPAAHAGLLVATTQNCGTETLSQPFLQFGDPMHYTVVPGGNFDGSANWNLSGGAQVVPGGDGYSLSGSPSTASLALPPGSSAVSPAICVGIHEPDLRFMAQNTGDPLSTMNVSVIFQTLLGQAELPIGTFLANGTWQPTAVDPILVNLLPLLPNQMTPIAFQFTPAGSGGNWQIDDVYVDPAGRS